MRLILLLSCLLFSTAWSSPQPVKTKNVKLYRYSVYSRHHLARAFKRAGVAYPPKELALLVFKKSRHLELYAGTQHHWHYIKTFRILAASGHTGPKMKQGDYQVPEGIYRISGLNPNSRFTLSMKINYPNAFDRMQAKRSHRTHLGGDIFIHGKAQSIGCIAIGDAGIEQLFPLVSNVGVRHVRVVIAPNDLRRHRPLYSRYHPQWLNTLYQKISLALSDFPLHG